MAAGRETAPPPQSLGTFIRSQRRLTALSLRQLADMTSVSNAYLSQVERGIRQPSLRVSRSLAGALDLRVEQLVERVGGDGVSAPTRRVMRLPLRPQSSPSSSIQSSTTRTSNC